MAYQSATLADLQAALLSRYDGVAFWTAPEATAALNEACRVWNGLTGFWKTRITVVAPPHDRWVPIPGSLLQRTRIDVAGVPLARGTRYELQYSHPGWMYQDVASAAGIPSAIAIWVPMGLSLIGIWPQPTIATTLTIDGIAATPQLVNAGDYLDLGDEEFSTLTGFALHLLTAKGPEQLFAATDPLRAAFYRAATAANTQFAASDFYRHYAGIDLDRSATPTHRPELEAEAKVSPLRSTT